MRKHRELTPEQIEARRKFFKNEKRDAVAAWGGWGFIVGIWATLVCSNFSGIERAVLAGLVFGTWGFVCLMSLWSVRVAERIGRDMDR